MRVCTGCGGIGHYYSNNGNATHKTIRLWYSFVPKKRSNIETTKFLATVHENVCWLCASMCSEHFWCEVYQPVLQIVNIYRATKSTWRTQNKWRIARNVCKVSCAACKLWEVKKTKKQLFERFDIDCRLLTATRKKSLSIDIKLRIALAVCTRALRSYMTWSSQYFYQLSARNMVLNQYGPLRAKHKQIGFFRLPQNAPLPTN